MRQALLSHLQLQIPLLQPQFQQLWLPLPQQLELIKTLLSLQHQQLAVALLPALP
jgi:hypothetical protein